MDQKEEIRLWYTQPGSGGFTDRYFTPLLSRRYKVVLDPLNPEYVITATSSAGKERSHFDYPHAVKIFFTGENIVPDFNLFDYALGFHHLDFGDRYMRYPLWLLYQSKIGVPLAPVQEAKFCNFVYSNNMHSDPIRSDLFDAVNAYKSVDSGGSFRNTLGHRVEDKLEFIRNYKFTIAVENSAVPGYTTEKLLEPSMMGTMPVYWGDPLVDQDFNTDRFVWIRSATPEDIEAAVQEIRYLDNNPQAYAEKMAKPIFRNNKTLDCWENEVLNFFSHIFDQSHSEAFRRARYGFNRHVTLQKQRAERMAESRWVRRMFGLIERLTNKHQKPTQTS